jgi:uncharacterized membrane protein|tara:strand:- start:107 stop:601 length:495 start_codon:yes stop_codon:yes gene_type:complete
VKKKTERIKELFLKLPNWAQLIVGFILLMAVIILCTIIWDFIGPSTKKWFLNPLGYIIILAIYGGIALFSGYHLVRVTIAVLQGIPKQFGETKMKEVPGLIGYLFIYLIWIFFTFTFLGATINWILDPFDMSLQSLGILPALYPGYFLDHPVYIFGYKVIPIFD